MDGSLQVKIEDDGIGFTRSKMEKLPRSDTGIGIMGMQERVSDLGGTFSVVSGESGGTRILVEIPVKSPVMG